MRSQSRPKRHMIALPPLFLIATLSARTDALFRAAWPRAALKGAGVGVLTATSMMLYKMQEIDLEGLEDRWVLNWPRSTCTIISLFVPLSTGCA